MINNCLLSNGLQKYKYFLFQSRFLKKMRQKIAKRWFFSALQARLFIEKSPY